MVEIEKEAVLRYRLICDAIPAIQEGGYGAALDELLDAGQREGTR